MILPFDSCDFRSYHQADEQTNSRNKMNDDLQHLKLLSIFHYVVAVFTALTGCFPVFHLAIGVALLSGQMPNQAADPVPAEVMGWMFTGIAGAVIVVMWSLAAVIFCSGRSLQNHRRHTFCLVVAGLECLLMPFGTVLGIFTIIVLLRPSVRQLFDEAETFGT